MLFDANIKKTRQINSIKPEEDLQSSAALHFVPQNFLKCFSVICLSDESAMIRLIKQGERVAAKKTKKQILPNCTSACSLLISLNKRHLLSSHTAARLV